MRPAPLATAVLGRFWGGVVGAIAAGLLAFGPAVFDPRAPAFQCISVGLVTAATFALLRARRAGQAVAVVSVFAVLRLGLAHSAGWLVACSGAVLGGGILVIAVVFDLLARRGIVIGKFAIVGALLGGAFLAVAPMVEFAVPTEQSIGFLLLRSVFVGVVIGNGVGLGVELAEVLGATAERARAVSE